MSELGAKLVNNEILVLIARVSMTLALPALSIFALLIQDKIDAMNISQDRALQVAVSQFEVQNQILANQMTELGKVVAADGANIISSGSRIVVLETRATQDAMRFAAFEQTMTGRYDKVQDALVELAKQVAALAATLRVSRMHSMGQMNSEVQSHPQEQ